MLVLKLQMFAETLGLSTWDSVSTALLHKELCAVFIGNT